MGLFDCFKKRFKKSAEEITVEEDSVEAEKALEKREELIESLEDSKPIHPPSPKAVETPAETGEQWDDFDEEPAEDPFAKPLERKERKKAKRASSVEKATKTSVKRERTPKDRMESTTGRKLVASGPAKIEIDFGDSASSTGGRVISGSEKLNKIIEELEEELLSADMAQSAVEEVSRTLKATLIGSRISTRKKLEVVIEEALTNALLRLLEAGTGISTRPCSRSSTPAPQSR